MQVLVNERVLLFSFDSATVRRASATAISVPVRQTDHVRVADWPGASPENVNVPIWDTVTTNGPAGALPTFVTVKLDRPSAVITRSGRGGATDHECVAGAPVLPAASVARTANVCDPGASAECVRGLEHVSKLAPSSEHENVEAGSEDVNWNTAVLPCVDAETIVVVGGVVSGGGTIVQLTVAAPPVFPAVSRARTANACGPRLRFW